MKRWLVLSLGIAIAAGAIYLLAVRKPSRSGGPPLDQIDDSSRARLEQVLTDAERQR